VGVDLLTDQPETDQEPAQVVVRRHLPARQRVDDREPTPAQQHVARGEVAVTDREGQIGWEQPGDERCSRGGDVAPRAAVEVVAVGAQPVDDVVTSALTDRAPGVGGVLLERPQPAAGEGAAGHGFVEIAAPPQPAETEHDGPQRGGGDEGHRQRGLLGHQQQGAHHAHSRDVLTGPFDRHQPGPLEKRQLRGARRLLAQPRTTAADRCAARVTADLDQRSRSRGAVEVHREQDAGGAVGQDPELEPGVRPIGEPLVGVRGEALLEGLDESPDRHPCPRRVLGPSESVARRRTVRLARLTGAEAAVTEAASRPRGVVPCPS
jgi:hypothetical protein